MDQNTTAQNIFTHVSAATSYCLLFSVNYAPTPSEEKEVFLRPMKYDPFSACKVLPGSVQYFKAETHRKQGAGLTSPLFGFLCWVQLHLL